MRKQIAIKTIRYQVADVSETLISGFMSAILCSPREHDTESEFSSTGTRGTALLRESPMCQLLRQVLLQKLLTLWNQMVRCLNSGIG